MFYSASPAQLQEEVSFYLDGADLISLPGFCGGIIAPHAGYTYSGMTAAYAYKSLNGAAYKTVIIISPSHREYFPGICVYSGDAFITPLGIVMVDKQKADALLTNEKNIFTGTQGHGKEHGIEVQLPFLQTVLPEFSIVPVVIGDQSPFFMLELANKLSEVLDKDTLIVASSDLSHYYPAARAEELDCKVEKFVSDYNYNKLEDALESGECEACGGGGIVAMMKGLAKSGTHAMRVLKRCTSGDVSGDYREVVGYLSAAAYSV